MEKNPTHPLLSNQKRVDGKWSTVPQTQLVPGETGGEIGVQKAAESSHKALGFQPSHHEAAALASATKPLVPKSNC